MRLVSNCFTAILATGFVLSAISAQISAQESSSGSQTSAVLPEAPRPQFVLTEVEPQAQRASDGHSEVSLQTSKDALPKPDEGGISGTVTDVNGDLIPDVTVMLDGLIPGDHRTVVANDDAAFQFDGLKAGTPYHVRINAKGFAGWNSPPVVLAPGQHVFLTNVQLKIEGEQASVTVYASSTQIAVEQVRVEEQQRVLGFIPNFYVVYDSKNAVPLTTKLKFKLALRVSIDPVSIAGVMFMAGIDQATNSTDYVQGMKGYGQRVGATAADSFSDILIGGAVLPSLLHQDPRYFYQGTGTTKSRVRHAVLNPFICKGDNGQWQPNYSSLGGDLASSALSNAYYPESNRGAGLVFGNFAIGTAERMASGFAQEFILARFTHGATNKH
jgi:hypothetical protein